MLNWNIEFDVLLCVFKFTSGFELLNLNARQNVYLNVRADVFGGGEVTRTEIQILRALSPQNRNRPPNQRFDDDFLSDACFALTFSRF